MRQTDLLTLDVDGVMTDGQLIYGSGGLELKAFNVQDGHAIKTLMAVIPVAIITGRDSDIVQRRAEELGIEHLYQGAADKTKALAALCQETGIDAARMAHAGDDIPDLALFDRVGLAFAPANAHPTVAQRADFVTSLSGGHGAVREICELLLMAKGRGDP